MAGTLITFAGLRCSSVRFARTRGYDSDFSTVELPVASFPDGFQFVEAKLGDVVGAIDKVIPDLAAIRTTSGSATRATVPQPPRGAALPDRVRLTFAGTLCMAEDQGDTWQTVVHPLFVRRVERVRAGAGGNARVRLTLVDIRYFARGFLRRWSFNRSRADGTPSPNALKAGGAPYLLQDVAAQIVGSLPRTPKLSAFPADWAKPCGHVEFAPFSPAISALAELERRGGVEPPCLRLDGSIAFHRPGDGRLGYAPGGEGENTADLPPDLRLWKQGTGHGYAIEATYPDDYVVVRGRERIMTIALDDWDPVLVVRARRRDSNAPQAAGVANVELAQGDEVGVPTVLPLDDVTVAKLSKGKLNLQGLRRWVMQPIAYQDAVGLEESVARLFREQAWRLWRLPKAETENLHLLPLLPRAETTGGGRRAPITVQTYRFKARHRRLAQGTGETQALASSRQRLQLLRDQIEAQARLQGKPSPFSGQDASLSDDALSIGDVLGPDVARTGGVSVEDLQNAMNKGRILDKIREVDAGAAADYERELRAQAEASGALNGTPDAAVLELGKRAAEFMRRLREARDARLSNTGRSLREFLENDADAQRLLDTFRRQAQGDLRALQKAEDEATTRSRTGTTARGLIPPEWGPIFVDNLPRTEDSGARVYSAEMGVVETSALPGHADPPGKPSPADTLFQPMPVRVIFGAVVRPRADVHPSGDSGGTKTRAQSAAPTVGDLADAVTWFVRAFARAGVGQAAELRVEDVPVGEGVVVLIDDHELIPLEGEGNTGALELRALELALERFRPKPVVESATYVVGRPWPVQCDGVVASVEIVAREGGKGFETRIAVGTGIRDPNPMRTRTRPPQQRDTGDAGRREGTAP